MRKLVFIATVLLASQVAQADFYTPIGSSGEQNFPGIADNLYGGSFTLQGNGRDYSNGAITLTRMVDSLSSVPTYIGVNMNVVSGPAFEATDQIWDDGATKIYAKARYASYAQNFGYNTDSDDNGIYETWNYLFSVNQGYDQTGQASPDLTGLDWTWGRQGTTVNSSYAVDNPDDVDHMLTYKVTGLPGQGSWTVWLLRWDDQTIKCGSGSDRDFNDSVIEIRAVPVPGAVLLGMLGLGVAGWKLRKYA